MDTSVCSDDDLEPRVDAHPGQALAAPDHGAWRQHLPPGPVHVALLHWGATPGFELQLLARILNAGKSRGIGQDLRFSWARVDQDGKPAVDALWVIQQDPSQFGPGAADLLDGRAGPTVLIGPAALWFAGTPQARGRRVAVHWEDVATREDLADDVVPSPCIIEISGRWTTCCGELAVVDLGLLMLSELAGGGAALQVMDALCWDRVREPSSRQRAAAGGALGTLVPKLDSALRLMEANVEEPLQTEEIARLVAVSRRQLERLFKQHLGTVPSRYYLDIRLQRARKLLRETRHSLLQVALMCGFSSGSYFSTTYSARFGIAPREERQRFLTKSAR